MSTLTNKLTEFMQDIEDEGETVGRLSSTKILLRYYMSIGLTNDTTFRGWMVGVSGGGFPAYSSVTRAIRKARSDNPRWIKHNVDKEVAAVKKEVGYEQV